MLKTEEKRRSEQMSTRSPAYEIALNRREPEFGQPDYLTLSFISKAICEVAEAIPVGQKIRILDLGCGAKPYLPFFEGKISEYTGVDMQASSGADIVMDLNKTLPLCNGEFDLVLCTQVLEHVESPNFLVMEAYRACKSGGTFLASAPFVWEIHNYPKDFWRFSKQGLEFMFKEFSSVEVVPCGNTAQGILQTLNLFINRSFKADRLKKLFFVFSNKYLLKIAGKFKDNLLPVNYVVRAVK